MNGTDEIRLDTGIDKNVLVIFLDSYEKVLDKVFGFGLRFEQPISINAESLIIFIEEIVEKRAVPLLEIKEKLFFFHQNIRYQ